MVVKFFKERISELNNITWPTRKQAAHAMVTVLIVMLVVGFFLTFVDSFFQEMMLKFMEASSS